MSSSTTMLVERKRGKQNTLQNTQHTKVGARLEGNQKNPTAFASLNSCPVQPFHSLFCFHTLFQ
jgi:hypothetical protein